MHFNVNFNMFFFKLIKVQFLVSELYITLLYFNTTLPSMLRFYKSSYSLNFSNQIPVCMSLSPHISHALLVSSPSI